MCHALPTQQQPCQAALPCCQHRSVACRSLLSRKLVVDSMLPLPALILLIQLLDSMPADQAAGMKKLNGSNSALLEVTVMLAEACSLCSSCLLLLCVA